DVNWTGGWGGALAISPSDASPDEAPRRGDLETAKLFGKRVAEVAAKLKG
ncbi:NADPH-dependent FMN reductase, partial [Xanthomonas perforans]|nr:NADPH-dependent FMN reductase [Xanthomonas perforans]